MFIKSTIVIGTALVTALASSAAVGAPQFFFPTTNFEDQDVERVVGDDGDGILEIGERLRGVFEIDRTAGNLVGQGPASILPDELTGVFELEVVGKTDIDGNGLFDFSFGPVAGGVNGLGAGVVAAFWLDGAPDLSVFPDCGTIAACETAATNGALWLTVGFAGDLDEGWNADEANDNFALINTLPAANVFGTVNFALSVFFNGTGQSLGLQPCANPSTCFDGVGDNMTQLTGSGTINGGLGLLEHDARSDFDFALAPQVPEPASLALFAVGLLGMGVTFRKKRNA